MEMGTRVDSFSNSVWVPAQIEAFPKSTVVLNKAVKKGGDSTHLKGSAKEKSIKCSPYRISEGMTSHSCAKACS